MLAPRPAKRTSKLLTTLARVDRTTLGPRWGQEKAPAMRGSRWSAARRRSASSLAVWGGGGPERAILAPSPAASVLGLESPPRAARGPVWLAGWWRAQAGGRGCRWGWFSGF